MQISVELMYLILQGGLYTCVVCETPPFLCVACTPLLDPVQGSSMERKTR